MPAGALQRLSDYSSLTLTDRQSEHCNCGSMASGKMYLLAPLCCFVIITTFAGTAQSASCCLRYTRRPLRCEQLIGYTIQNINKSCDISAIIFHLPGRFVCANPRLPWTQRGMKCVDEKTRSKDNEQEEAPGSTFP